MKNRAQQYDIMSFIFVALGILGLLACCCFALYQHYKMACVTGISGLLSARLSYKFARLALAAEGRKSPNTP